MDRLETYNCGCPAFILFFGRGCLKMRFCIYLFFYRECVNFSFPLFPLLFSLPISFFDHKPISKRIEKDINTKAIKQTFGQTSFKLPILFESFGFLFLLEVLSVDLLPALFPVSFCISHSIFCFFHFTGLL